MQIYTNFESNSQHHFISTIFFFRCFRCKFTQILKAIHNKLLLKVKLTKVVFDENLNKY